MKTTPEVLGKFLSLSKEDQMFAVERKIELLDLFFYFPS